MRRYHVSAGSSLQVLWIANRHDYSGWWRSGKFLHAQRKVDLKISAQIAFIYLTLIAYLLCEAVRTGSICDLAHGMARPTSSTLERFGLPTVRAHRGATLLTLHSVRAKGAAIGLASINLTAVWLSWATPYALVSIAWRYWIVRHFHHRGFGVVDLD
jgi:hypothetical protein